ncbi:MAG TPA: hypothetical protein VLW65_07530 [Bryobacteraceae bacterium]|nr:hypothetical protein [Bryobacteraceae bacterium]
MGYTRRRAVLSDIERLCSIALAAYGDSANALKAGEAERFWRSLERLRIAAAELDGLLSPGDTSEWLGLSEQSPLHQTGAGPLPARLTGMPLPDCARFFDSDALPALLVAVAELNHAAQERMAYLRQVV